MIRDSSHIFYQTNLVHVKSVLSDEKENSWKFSLETKLEMM